MLGTLHSAIRGLWRYEAVVDKWPGFTALVLRPLQLVPRQSRVSQYELLFSLLRLLTTISDFAKTGNMDC